MSIFFPENPNSRHTIKQENDHKAAPPLFHQFDLLPLFHLPLSLMTSFPLALCLADLLTDITALGFLLLLRHNIKSGFIASPYSPTRRWLNIYSSLWSLTEKQTSCSDLSEIYPTSIHPAVCVLICVWSTHLTICPPILYPSILPFAVPLHFSFYERLEDGHRHADVIVFLPWAGSSAPPWINMDYRNWALTRSRAHRSNNRPGVCDCSTSLKLDAAMDT